MTRRAPLLLAAGLALVVPGGGAGAAKAAPTVRLIFGGDVMLGRGVDAPMPVILLGALGGMAAAGILGMFVGATLLALGYQIFMGWVAARDEVPASEQKP